MSLVERYAPGTPCWVDLLAADREAAMAFYGPLLGWDFQVGGREMGYYTRAYLQGQPVAGIAEQSEAMGGTGHPVVWTTYFATDDADTALAAIKASGGRVVAEPMAVSDEGRMAVAADPDDAVFGLWQRGVHNIGARVVNEPGALSWNELVSRDARTVRNFYAAVFGYAYEQIGDGVAFDYTTLLLGGRSVGGIMQIDPSWPAEVPSHWATYFSVDDADKTAAHAAELGGTVLTGPFDSPYGRLTGLADPQGGRFTAIQLAQQPAQQPAQ